MRKLLLCLAVVLLGTIMDAVSLNGQRYGSWDVPCDGGLSPRFSAPFSHGVIYGGKEFLTNWSSVLGTRPLPSYNWYYASPDRNPTSKDGTSRWDNAGVYVHCWVERNPYYLTQHRDPVGYRGTVRPVTTACGEFGGGDTQTELFAVVSDEYDPYDSALTLSDGGGDCGSEGENTGSGTQYQPGDSTGGETVSWGTGEGNGGTSVCGQLAVVEYVCIDLWDDATGTWVEWGCGYVTTC